MPMMIALRRRSAGRPAAAMPMTTALSPASTRSIMITCMKEVRNPGSNILGSPRRSGATSLDKRAALSTHRRDVAPVEPVESPREQRRRQPRRDAEPACAGPRRPGRDDRSARARRRPLHPRRPRQPRRLVGRKPRRRVLGARRATRRAPRRPPAPCVAPCARNGIIGWQASPSSASRPVDPAASGGWSNSPQSKHSSTAASSAPAAPPSRRRRARSAPDRPARTSPPPPRPRAPRPPRG